MRDYRPNTATEKFQAFLLTAFVGLSMLLFLFGMASLLSGCAVLPPPVVTPPVVQIDQQAVKVCGDLWRDELGREIDPMASDDCASFLSRGLRTLEDYRASIRATDEWAEYRARLEAERATRARAGAVGLAGRVFTDAAGPWLAVGASHFSSGWLFLHDRPKFDQELLTLKGRVDFLRAFVLVGPGGYWEDRQLGPNDLGMVAAVTDAHYAAGFRTQWTVFAGIDTVPNLDARRQVIARLCADLQPRQEKIQFLEVANEGWQNGFDGDAGRAELLEHGATLRACLPQTQVALTAPNGPDLASIYAGSPTTLATAPLELNTEGTGGPFRPLRQSREFSEKAWP